MAHCRAKIKNYVLHDSVSILISILFQISTKLLLYYITGNITGYNRFLTLMYVLRVPVLTPWCRVLLEKLTGVQLVKKFPAFHRTLRFITALTSVRHLSLSWANPIQSIYPHPTSWRSILILPTHLRLGLPSGLLPSGFPSLLLSTSFPVHYSLPPNLSALWDEQLLTAPVNDRTHICFQTTVTYNC